MLLELAKSDYLHGNTAGNLYVQTDLVASHTQLLELQAEVQPAHCVKSVSISSWVRATTVAGVNSCNLLLKCKEYTRTSLSLMMSSTARTPGSWYS